MKLKYDPTQGESFWTAIRAIPGFPLKDEIPLRTIFIAPGAIFRVPSVLRALSPDPTQKVVMVMDPTPMRRAEQSLKPLVEQVLKNAGWGVEALVLEPDSTGQVYTDMHQIETVKAHLHRNIAVLAVGSGTVTDITKHACFLYEQEGAWHVPFLVFQTANSVSAYTSSMAPVFIEGVKRTLSSRYPDALICDLETLRDAPREMTVAGVGDMLAAFVSFPDWYLAYKLGMDDHYTNLPQELIGPLDEILTYYARDISDLTLTGMEVLAKLIALGGLAMSLSHATTPLSGYEHVMSHILDLLNEKQHKPLNIHGSQIALTTLLASQAYRTFLTTFTPRDVNLAACFPDPQTMRTHILDNFLEVDSSGKAGEECWSDYCIKLERWNNHQNAVKQFLAGWSSVKAEITALARPPETILRILQVLDAPLHFHQLSSPCGGKEVCFSFMNAPFMRKRLTLGDVLFFFGFDRVKMWHQIW
jgi:glycerol-1-phosphate dehydrogenase [NAD(P)+]